MDFRLSNGHSFCFQWDTKIKLYINDGSPVVHFKWNNRAVPFKVIDNGVYIPEELMQKDDDISFWTYDGSKSIYHGTIRVKRKPRPVDYIYTPTEIKRWGDLDERIKVLEKNNTAVLYTEQELTEEQKAQARENIDAFGAHYGLTPTTYYYKAGAMISNKNKKTVYVGAGEFIPLNEELQETYDAIWRGFNITLGNLLANPSYGSLNLVQRVCTLCEVGVFGENFFSENKSTTLYLFSKNITQDSLYSRVIVSKLSYSYNGSANVLYYSTYRYDLMEYQNFYYDYIKKEIIGCVSKSFLAVTSIDPASNYKLNQIEMSATPTQDMHIATKKYVDDKTIAPTSNDSLELLAETGFITPAQQDGVIYTAPTGEIYVI